MLLFSRLVTSSSSQPRGLQHIMLLCCSLSPRVCSDLCPLSRCHPTISSTFSSCPQSFPSIRVFSSESALRIKWPKCWCFSFSISPSNEYSGLISFGIDWFVLLAVQGTLKTSPAPQFESISSSVFSLLYGPALTSIQDYWKNHSFDYIDLCHLA